MLNRMSKPVSGKIKALCLLLIGVGLSLGACVSRQQAPVEAIQAADKAIQQAEDARFFAHMYAYHIANSPDKHDEDKANSGDYASAELGAARDKIITARAMAEKAIQENDKKAAQKALWLANESRSDAELAAAKAQESRARAVSQDMQQNIDLLSPELPPKSGG